MKNGQKVVLTIGSPISLYVIEGGVALLEEEIPPERYNGLIIPSPTDHISQRNPDGHPARLWVSLSYNGKILGRSLVSVAGERGVSIRKTK